ncbi:MULTISPECIES: histidine phosphatase family protein [unclassified Rhizobium]|uniref:SixA phosphatase family protein n=1 Tax=unclassified Rhizobium TaxID=2613769 RepID=UPI0016210BB8|nr:MULTISPECIES: histidine phosphatase family protein [unclassified Rhizobium]MBB3542777.1 phosphohistidine phosphatase [Rhizobium sp. BK399]MCS3739577.1 phosphohistidine phosphatase [Rhizobium sp. BK661]MCS4091218.1 phosphohistidine phosphatase [Rhizobium sp. BK176]
MSAAKPSTKRRLLLLRHAKSAWPENVPDHDRPLAGRGEKAAPLMGRYLAREKLIPDLVLVSSARRTQETWGLLAKKLPSAIAKRDAEDLYEASAAKIAAVVQTIDPKVRTLMLIGHNPGFQDLADGLIGEGDADACARIREKFPTAALAVIEFDADRWKDLKPRSGMLERFITPRSLA